VTAEAAAVVAAIAREHRQLDELLGLALAAFSARDAVRAREAVSAFDEELRTHTAREENHLYARASGRKLLAGPEEPDGDRLRRELSVEHVQIREVSGMILRLLEEKEDPEGARALLPNLLRRWDAHTTREEAQLAGLVPEERASALARIFSVSERDRE